MENTTTAPVQESAPGTTTDQPAAPAVSVELDRLNRPFDPEKFRHEKDVTGRWKNLKAGRKSGKAAPSTAKAAKAAPKAKGAALEATPPPDLSDIEAASKLPPAPTLEEAENFDLGKLGPNQTAESCIGIFQTALVLIGKEDGVLSEAEKELVRGPIVRCLQKYEIGSDVMPCELELAVAMAGIVIVRLKKPKFAAGFLGVKQWVSGLFQRATGYVQGAVLAHRVEKATE